MFREGVLSVGAYWLMSCKLTFKVKNDYDAQLLIALHKALCTTSFTNDLSLLLLPEALAAICEKIDDFEPFKGYDQWDDRHWELLGIAKNRLLEFLKEKGKDA